MLNTQRTSQDDCLERQQALQRRREAAEKRFDDMPILLSLLGALALTLGVEHAAPIMQSTDDLLRTIVVFAVLWITSAVMWLGCVAARRLELAYGAWIIALAAMRMLSLALVANLGLILAVMIGACVLLGPDVWSRFAVIDIAPGHLVAVASLVPATLALTAWLMTCATEAALRRRP